MDSVFEAYLGQAEGGEPDDIPKHNTTVWVLGRSYNAVQQLELIRRDIQSRLWCTYRRGFVPLGETQLTTDKGWGCMLRCGQMVLAQALIDLHLGRDWFWTPENRDSTYLKIVKRFEDSRRSYFSIHQIALMGDSEDKKVGEWFGPNTIAQVLKKLVRYDDWCSLVVHVAMDNIVVTDEILSLCQQKPNNDESWTPLLLIVPLRLGLNEINPIYVSALKRCFELVGCCGMIGGRPNQALYLIGYVDESFLFLDPHVTQRSGTVGLKMSQDEIEFDETFHRKYAGRLSFQQMDPSLAVCFLCKSRTSFDVLIDKLRNEVLTASTQPLFEITNKRAPEWHTMAGMDTDCYASTISETEPAFNSSTFNSFTYEAIDCISASTNCSNATSSIVPTLTTTTTITTTTTSSNESRYPYDSSHCNRTTSFCDSEDFETVPHASLNNSSCCELEAESDEDFEIIS